MLGCECPETNADPLERVEKMLPGCLTFGCQARQKFLLPPAFQEVMPPRGTIHTPHRVTEHTKRTTCQPLHQQQINRLLGQPTDQRIRPRPSHKATIQNGLIDRTTNYSLPVPPIQHVAITVTWMTKNLPRPKHSMTQNVEGRCELSDKS